MDGNDNNAGGEGGDTGLGVVEVCSNMSQDLRSSNDGDGKNPSG